MLGILELFGASRPVQRLDRALRAVGVHPRLVPGAVKIATIRQLESRPRQGGADETACAHAAALLGYLMHGQQIFTEDNGALAAAGAEDRIMAAIGAGTGPDARLVLLALHAGIVAQEVIDDYRLEVD
ncbi:MULTISPECIES: hypothetical protein [unclassified Minwuia]|uniref:hypothetical protein n=1 Tax=unclassified Minwuia TaxID=2618799 RepID=UPI00247AF87C|nr:MULTISPECIES: hypothetical protein [unclassified Minwuia]